MLYEISVKFKDPEGVKSLLLLEFFAGLNIDPARTVESVSGTSSRISFYSETKREAGLLSERMKKAGLQKIKVSVSALEDEDWKTKWAKYYKPFSIVDGIRVIPYDLRSKYNVDPARDIIIRTDVIFGTGLHDTTRFMAEFIFLKRKVLGDFLDAGTGTGLLSLIASRCGAVNIYCFDIDPEAVRNASFNFKINRFKPVFLEEKDIKGYSSERVFDFVAANLLTRDLLEAKDDLFKNVKPGGYLGVSGISAENYSYFRDAFGRGELKCIRVRKTTEWAGILYKRVS
jgi:ribosomal protein L11 methyltransferase